MTMRDQVREDGVEVGGVKRVVEMDQTQRKRARRARAEVPVKLVQTVHARAVVYRRKEGRQVTIQAEVEVNPRILLLMMIRKKAKGKAVEVQVAAPVGREIPLRKIPERRQEADQERGGAEALKEPRKLPRKAAR